LGTQKTVEDYVPAPPIMEKSELVGKNFVVLDFGKAFSTKFGETIPVSIALADGTKRRILIDPEGALNDSAVISKRVTLRKDRSQEHPGQSYFLWDAPKE